LQEREDPLVRQGLVEALLVFYVEAPDDAPAVIKGAVQRRPGACRFPFKELQRKGGAAVQFNLGRMCAALSDLKQSLDMASTSIDPN